MKTRKLLSNRSTLLLIITVLSLCTSGCAAPLAALGTSAGGAGMQALAGATGAAGMQMLGDKVGDAMEYMQSGEQIADVTYWTRVGLLKNIVDQTLRETVSSSFVALQYSRDDQEDEGLFLLSTSTGNELRVVVKEDPSFDDPYATQMIVDMEIVEVASQKTETSEFVDVMQEIDSETQRHGIQMIRGDFNYTAGLSAYDSKQIQQRIKVARQQQEQNTQT